MENLIISIETILSETCTLNSAGDEQTGNDVKWDGQMLGKNEPRYPFLLSAIQLCFPNAPICGERHIMT